MSDRAHHHEATVAFGVRSPAVEPYASVEAEAQEAQVVEEEQATEGDMEIVEEFVYVPPLEAPAPEPAQIPARFPHYPASRVFTPGFPTPGFPSRFVLPAKVATADATVVPPVPESSMPDEVPAIAMPNTLQAGLGLAGVFALKGAAAFALAAHPRTRPLLARAFGALAEMSSGAAKVEARLVSKQAQISRLEADLAASKGREVSTQAQISRMEAELTEALAKAAKA